MSLPSATVAAAPPVPRTEMDAMLASLKPPKRERPLIAVIGINDATETTDYIVPTGILRRANVADVMMLATGPGPVQLYPALKVEPDATTSEFDAAHPEGADYVIVPAMSRDDDPAALAWLRTQAEKGATIIGVCAGAKVVGAAGLLDGKRATTHWYYLGEMLKHSPTIDYVADRRMVLDGSVVTTTGITASMPMMLTVIEAIGGRAKADSVARDLGIEEWNAQHASGAFRLTRPFATTVLANRLAFWKPGRTRNPVGAGHGRSIACPCDRCLVTTYRSTVLTFANAPGTVETRNGIRVIPDQIVDWQQERRVSTFPDQPPAKALDLTLQAISERYGERTTNVVAMQLEYPR
jgi:transcriptional regulator GlxA family with amidase domain